MKKVLFVCTANIHRSRFAEEVFNYFCAKHNKDYHAFSAGLRVGDYSFRKIYYPALENLKAFFTSISKSKPDAVKGSFIKKVTIASTMGVGLEVNLTSLR